MVGILQMELKKNIFLIEFFFLFKFIPNRLVDNLSFLM